MNLSGPVLDWNLQGSIKYSVGVMTYGELKNLVEIRIFDASTGTGEQRFPKHAKKLKKEILAGRYVPTTFYLGTNEEHRKNVKIEDDNFFLEVDSENKLPALDAGGRIAALNQIYHEADNTLKQKMDWKLHIPYLITLSGNNQQHFLAYNKGESVSRDLKESMQAYAGLLPAKISPYMLLARQVAHELNTREDSLWENLIQFDQSSEDKPPFSCKTLCATASRDLACSLFGGAKIIHRYVKDGRDAVWLADCIIKAHEELMADSDGVRLFDQDKVLATEIRPGVASKTSTSLLIGLGNMLAVRLILKECKEIDQQSLDKLVQASLDVFDVNLADNTHRDSKAYLLAKFGRLFFEDCILGDDEDVNLSVKRVANYHGLPRTLVEDLSPSAFKLPAFPTKPKTNKKKVKPDPDPDPEPPVFINQSLDDDYFKEEDKDNEERLEKLNQENIISVEELLPCELGV